MFGNSRKVAQLENGELHQNVNPGLFDSKAHAPNSLGGFMDSWFFIASPEHFSPVYRWGNRDSEK